MFCRDVDWNLFIDLLFIDGNLFTYSGTEKTSVCWQLDCILGDEK